MLPWSEKWSWSQLHLKLLEMACIEQVLAQAPESGLCVELVVTMAFAEKSGSNVVVESLGIDP